jgi:hypothetical protein
MARINDGTLRDWNNGDKLTSEGYEQDREILRIANNDNADRIESLETKNAGLDSRVTATEGDIEVLQATDETHNSRISSLENYEPVQDQRLTDLEYNVTGTVVPRTFQELGMQNTTFDDIKLGYIDKQVTESMNVTVPAQLQALEASYSPRLGNVESSLADNTTKITDLKRNIIYVKSTDDLQAAFTNIQSNQTIILQDGQYDINSPLTLNTKSYVTIRGLGRAIINFTGTGHVLTLTSCTSIKLENLQIQSNGANNGHGVYLNNSLRVNMLNCTVYNVSYHCLETLNSFWFSSKDCVFDKANTTGYSCVHHGANSNNMLHLHSRFIAKNGNVNVLIDNGYGITISSCDISGDGTNIGIDASAVAGLSIINNYFEANLIGLRYGNSQYTVGLEVSGNYFNAQVGNGIGISIVNGAYIRIGGNYFIGLASSTGILVSTNNNNKFIDIASNNYFQSFGTKVSDASNYSSYTGMRQIKYGWGQIPAGQTTAVINHTCGAVPNSIVISPQTNVGGNIWYTDPNATSFTANCATNSGSAVNFGWMAIL